MWRRKGVKNKVILLGDYYHNKIDERIEGYLKALNDYGIYNERVDSKLIDDSHEHYQLIGFCGWNHKLWWNFDVESNYIRNSF